MDTNIDYIKFHCNILQDSLDFDPRKHFRISYLVNPLLDCLLHKKPERVFIQMIESKRTFNQMIATKLPKHPTMFTQMIETMVKSPVDTRGFFLTNSVNSTDGLKLLRWVQQRLHLENENSTGLDAK